jgi:ribosomal-protein-alanine N-acetyltransferase
MPVIGEIEIEKMKLKDLPRVIEIELTSFSTPWSHYAFLSELRDNHFAHYVVAKLKMHDKEEPEIVGYAGMWIVMNEAHITNIAVAPDYRGMGIGKLLMENMMKLAKENGADKMTLEVRKSNYIARHLYERLGFKARGIRRGYYSDNNEDAVIMWKDEL